MTTRRVREDAYPENIEWHDTGCEIAPSCLACPLPECKYDAAPAAAPRGVGISIAVACEELGLTQAQLGKLLDVPQPTISAWQRGAVRVRHPAMLRLALEALVARAEA
jgi:hypothetical protein